MMKHAMWMAFEHRRQALGFDARNGGGEASLNSVEACSSADEEATDTEAENTLTILRSAKAWVRRRSPVHR